MPYLILSRDWVLVFGAFILSTYDVQAYIDPGSGSYLFQILIAGLTGAVFFFSEIRRSIIAAYKNFLRKEKNKTEEPPENV